MEADSIMNMVEYALRHICFIIDIIVSDNDIKMWSIINHPTWCADKKCSSNKKGNFTVKSQCYHSLQIPTIKWMLL